MVHRFQDIEQYLSFLINYIANVIPEMFLEEGGFRAFRDSSYKFSSGKQGHLVQFFIGSKEIKNFFTLRLFIAHFELSIKGIM